MDSRLALPLAAAIALAAAGLTSLASSGSRAASFNCAEAASPSEIAICANPILSALDSELGRAYAARLARDPSVRQVERGWLAARNVGCGHGVTCLERFTRGEIAWLRAGGAMPSSVPTMPGACALTAVRNVTNRLANSPDMTPVPGSGSAINETDEGYQVSYDQVPAIDASQPGDPILLCLAHLPAHCPPGDDRGKIFAAANLRTLGAWSLPDSEHSCGGA